MEIKRINKRPSSSDEIFLFPIETLSLEFQWSQLSIIGIMMIPVSKTG